MSRREIGEWALYSMSIEMDVPSYESMRYLPDAVVVRFDKKREQTKEVPQPSNQLVTYNSM
jgi:hypothetical protein